MTIAAMCAFLAVALIEPQSLGADNDLCLECHAESELIREGDHRPGSSVFVDIDQLDASVHEGMDCTDCHLDATDDHDERLNAADCADCHGDVQAEYERSVHGRAVAGGATGAPTCIDCHGEHDIRSPDDPLSRVYPSAIVASTCVQCHENERIISRYGLARGRAASYRDTYHGLAIGDGTVQTAHCASCHRVHDILPSADPSSTIHADNLQATCGTCHPDAGERFAQIPVHEGAGTSGRGDELATLVRQIYIGIIAVTIAAMGLHNGAIVLHAVREKYRRRRESTAYQRFNRFQVAQHAILVLSFVVLVITGFALKFADAWWVGPLRWVGMDEALRRVIHRAAGSVMMVQSAIYVAYLAGWRQGRRELVSLLPRTQDLRDLALALRYYAGRSQTKPVFDRYGYPEKAEFWALVWGVMLMGVTGMILWVPEAATRFLQLPGWAVGISEIVHYYEAWLATLAILVWHIFYVVFHPDEYPLNLTFLDGRILEEDQAAHHPLEQPAAEGGPE